MEHPLAHPLTIHALELDEYSWPLTVAAWCSSLELPGGDREKMTAVGEGGGG